jgi:tRNA(Ile)-lysidine synthase
MEKIEQKILKFIKDKNLIEKKDNILVALSGGPDSVALLCFLNKFKEKLKIELGAIHINHLIRGKDAYEDEEFCKNLCLTLNIKFFLVRKKVKLFASKNKISIEQAGRKIRYDQFVKTATKYGFNKIATAHNSSDNIETIFLNLIKGTGLNGITGIPVKRENIIRPFLQVSKEEIFRYIKENSLIYRLDASNFSNHYERNFLRNEIIPAIKQRLNPDIENSFINSSDIFQNAVSLINKSVKIASENTVKYDGESVKFFIKELIKYDKALYGFLFKNVLEGKYKFQFSYNDINKIISLLNKEAGKKEELSGKHLAIRDRDEIVIFPFSKENNLEQINIKPGEIIKLKNKFLSIKEIKILPKTFSGSKYKEYISAEKIEGNFLLRQWEKGDRFNPLGLNGTKNVSDFLNEQKIPSSEKKKQLVLLNNNKIVWVVGLRLDERFKITNKTKKAYELWLK